MLCKFRREINNQWSTFFCFLKFIIEVGICKVGLCIRQFHCNANCEFQTKVFYMIILDVFSGFTCNLVDLSLV